MYSLSTYTRNPSTAYLTVANQILQYLKHSRHLAITYYKNYIDPQIYTATDASLADALGAYSSKGYVIFFYGGLVIWTSYY
jgi:hypothetical protein